MQQVQHHQDVTPTHNGRRSLAGATYTKASFMRVMMRVTHLFYKNLSTRKNSVNRDKTPITIFLLLYILVSSPTEFSSFSNSLSPLPHCQQQKILLFLILEVQFPATASSSLLLLLPPEEKKTRRRRTLPPTTNPIHHFLRSTKQTSKKKQTNRTNTVLLLLLLLLHKRRRGGGNKHPEEKTELLLERKN